MKIFKEADNFHVYQLHGITDDQLISLNDIAKNYRAYLQEMVKMPDYQLQKHAKGNPEKIREAMKLQIITCWAYEMAFNEVISKAEPKDPTVN